MHRLLVKRCPGLWLRLRFLLLCAPLCIESRLRNITIATIRSHALLNRTLVELIDRFRQHGIYPVLLKGQGVASNYIEPTLRICGDIDLYIGKQDYDRACRLAKSWIINTDNEHGEESEKHYHFKYGVVTVELHRLAEQLSLPWQNARFQVWTQKHLHGAHLRSIVIEATVISLPPVNFDALYIFEHVWHHLIDGMGLGCDNYATGCAICTAFTMKSTVRSLKWI